MLCRMARSVIRLALAVGVSGVVLAFGGSAVSRAVGGQDGATLAIDFQAVLADGQPVMDLKADEVSIRVAGRVRSVRSLRVVRVATGSSTPALLPFGTNVGGDEGRQVAIVVEDDSFRAGIDRQLREALGKFLDALGPADRVSLSTAPRDTIGLGFGAGLAKVRGALGQIQGHATPSDTSDQDACRTRDTLAALHGRLTAMGGDTPTTVLVFSSKLTAPTSTTSRGANRCDINVQAYQLVASAAAAARAQMYVVQPDESATQRDEGLEALAAGSTGGQVMRLTAAGGLSRLVAETSAYYVATVDADPADRSNQAQRLELRVTRGGVTTRARQELAPSRPVKPASALTPQQMLRELRAFRDLPIRAVAYASRGAGGRMTVIILGESADPATKLTAAAAALIDPTGRLVAQATASDKELAAAPITIATAVPPGPYRMRFAATDASGRGGAADYDVVADLTAAGPLKLGSLLIGSLRNGSMAMGLQFRDEETLVGYLEMYGQIAAAKVSARMEVAATPDGPALATVQPGGSGTSEPDRFILTAEIPIAALAPGDYLVRAFVAVEGSPEGKVVKVFRKVGK